MKRSSKVDIDNFKSVVTQSQMVYTRSVYGEPIKSSLRILFCCKLERSPLVHFLYQVIILFILVLDIIRWLAVGALTFDFNMVGFDHPGYQLAIHRQAYRCRPLYYCSDDGGDLQP